MTKQICFHFAQDVNEGQYHRIRKLQNDISKLTNSEYHEFQVVGMVSFLKRGLSFLNTPPAVSTGKKTVLPIRLPGYRKFRVIRAINTMLARFFGAVIGFIYKPDYCIGETHISFPFLLGLSITSSRSKLFFDFHGAFPEEIAYVNNLQKWEIDYITEEDKNEGAILALANVIICQSDAMFTHLVTKHPISPSNNLIYQCGVDTESFHFSPEFRVKIRADLNLDKNEIVFVYLGSLHSWQLIDSVFEIFSEIIKLDTQYSAKLLILTHEPIELVLKHAKRFGVNEEDLRILCAPHRDVPHYLSACDLGFLLREDTTLNRVACPTKLGEYLACGVPIITTRIANYWSWTKGNYSAIHVIDYTKPKEAALSIAYFIQKMQSKTIETTRMECRDIALQQLSMAKDYTNLKSII